MAPPPEHLPKKPVSQDVCSEILSKIGEATYQTLNSSVTSSWIAELDEAIHSTQNKIHARIQKDLPKFKHQVETAKSVKLRLRQMTEGVDALSSAISDPDKGLVPTLVKRLTTHSALAQETMDAEVTSDVLSYLLRCKTQYTRVMSLVQYGKLPAAVAAFVEMDLLVDASPNGLKRALVMADLKRKLQTLKTRVEEQLSNAFSESIEVQPSSIIVRQTVQVAQSDVSLSSSEVASSLSLDALVNHLSIFRRDFTAHFIDHLLQQPYSITVESAVSERKLSLIPSSPNTELRATRLENLSNVLEFVTANVFPVLPSTQSSIFQRSLIKPITAGILNILIIPSLPPSFGLLPPFLDLVEAAVKFEEKYALGLLGGDPYDRLIKAWSDGLCSHYEKRRRVVILERSRSLVIEPEDPPSTFQAEVERPLETALPTVVNGDDFKDDAWGFDDDSGLNSASEEKDSWDFDDNGGNGPEPEEEPEPEETVASGVSPSDEPDPSDAWGWNDDSIEEDLPPEDTSEDTAWDDPWSDSLPSAKEPELPSKTVVSPKAATRLERLASKNKKHVNGSLSHHPASPPLPAPPTLPVVPQQIFSPQHVSDSDQSPVNGRRPTKLITIVPKETYRVTTRMKRVVRLVEDAIAEAKQFTASNLFSQLATGSTPGTTLFQAAISTLDLYQALFPVKFGKEMETIDNALQFSNDCLYLSDSIEKFERELSGQPLLLERLSECRAHLKVVSDSWFDDAVEKQCLERDRVLTEGTQGFTYTGDQDRYDECETAITQVVRFIKASAKLLKQILSKSRYYIAIGKLADAALSRVLRDIIALPDIPELESRRLSELCRIFNSLEGLFSEDPTQPSFVVAYVSSWLKFSYLSELLEASMADIKYLFEQGALVDFETEELVKLVRALFTDTALRTNTINRIQSGQTTSTF